MPIFPYIRKDQVLVSLAFLSSMIKLSGIGYRRLNSKVIAYFGPGCAVYYIYYVSGRAAGDPPDPATAHKLF